MGRKLWPFKANRRINVYNPIASLPQQRSNLPKEYEAGCGAPFGRSIWKMPADVTQRRGAQQRIADGVRQRVAIRVAYRTLRERDPHSAQDQLAARGERVYVVPNAGAKRR